VKSGGFSISQEVWKGDSKLSVIEFEGSASIAAAFTPKGGEAKEGAGSPIKVASDVGGKGDKAKLAAQKELDLGWSFKPKVVGEVEVTDKGVKGKLGLSAEREGWKIGAFELGANEFSFDIASYDSEKKETKVLTATWTTSAKLSGATMKILGEDYDVSGSISASLSVHPCWAEIGKMIAEKIASMTAGQIAMAAGAAALPIGVFIGGLVGWAKAGHEFDEVSNKITSMATTCRTAAAEALSGKHNAIMMGNTDMAGSAGSLATQIRTEVAAQLGVPVGALADVAKAKPNLPNAIYAAAWHQKWPPLKAAILAQWQDTFWKSYKFERDWLDTFETGPYAPHDTKV
jgi:hypothetical protein